MWRGGLALRTQLGPHSYHIPRFGIVLIIAATLTFAVGFVFLIRSPFRMSLPERLFRLVWLGPAGRAFVRIAGAGVVRKGDEAAMTPRTTTTRGSAPPPVIKVSSGVAAERVASLESRVAELERWRSGADRA